MIEVKIDIVSDKDESKRATMDTILITRVGNGQYMVLSDDRSNPCFVRNFKEDDGELELIKQAISSLDKSGNYCHINIIPDEIDREA